MKFWHKLVYRPLKENEFVTEDGVIGHLVENSDIHLIFSVPHEMGSTFYNFDKRTGQKRINRIYVTGA